MVLVNLDRTIDVLLPGLKQCWVRSLNEKARVSEVCENDAHIGVEDGGLYVEANGRRIYTLSRKTLRRWFEAHRYGRAKAAMKDAATRVVREWRVAA